MKNLLALVGLLVVGFGGVGWYCGWYQLSLSKSENGNLQIETEVNTKKVTQDSSAFFEKVGKIAGEQLDKNGKPQRAPAAVPGPETVPATAKEKDEFQGGWLLPQPVRSATNR
jgi:hypothetical protein